MPRLHRLATSAAAVLALAATAAPADAAETLKLDLSDVRNAIEDPASAPAQSAPLVAGVPYIVTVSGTGSIWEPSAFQSNGTCGVPEIQPMEPSPGRANSVAAWDAATVFAAPIDATIAPFGRSCDDVPLPFPSIAEKEGGQHLTAGFEFATGAKYNRRAPIGGHRTTPRVDHTYSWEVTGQGLPFRARFADNPSKDNSGVFTITVRPVDECQVTNCLATAAPTFDAVVPAGVSLPVAAPIAVQTPGTRSCKGLGTLNVTLKEPKGVDFRKATFFLNGKKTRVLFRETKRANRRLVYTAGKRKGQIKRQSFAKLPSGAIKLEVQVITTRGQTLTIKRTIPACTTKTKTRTLSFR